MIGRMRALLPAVFLLMPWTVEPAPGFEQPPSNRKVVKVFLDCTACFEEFLRAEVTFVEYVRDRTQADVHVLVTRAETGSGGREYTLEFIGEPPDFEGVTRSLKTVTSISDPEDTIRRQLATALRVGLLNYVTRDGVPAELAVTVRSGGEQSAGQPQVDPWNLWVYSLRGSASFEGEESRRERQLGAEAGASRITPDWKITLGVEIEQQVEDIDLDEETPVKVERREREFQTLVVKGLGEHWSVGARTDVESSTFDNTKLSLEAAPALEYNVFPYSMYTRRQLRAQYSIGVAHVRYYEQTLFGKTEETLGQHELSLTYEQRERWGSIEARTEWSQYLHDLGKTRLEARGQLSIRIAQGLSADAEVDASRIRDQLFLPLRGATPEEVLLRLRRLQSGYEYGFRFGLTYTFGSIFSSIVNPRFGR